MSKANGEKSFDQVEEPSQESHELPPVPFSSHASLDPTQGALQRLEIANVECQGELIEDCRDTMSKIADKIKKGHLYHRFGLMVPDIFLLPLPRLNAESGVLEIAVYSLYWRTMNETTCKDVVNALEKAHLFPYSSSLSNGSTKKNSSFLEKAALLEAITVYLEDITGVTTDVSDYRHANYKEAIKQLDTAVFCSPMAGQFESHLIENEQTIIDDSKLAGFKDDLLAFLSSKISRKSVNPVAETAEMDNPFAGIFTPESQNNPPLSVKDITQQQDAPSTTSQSLLPPGVGLSEATSKMVMNALYSDRLNKGKEK